MKKIILLAITCLFMISILSGCSGKVYRFDIQSESIESIRIYEVGGNGSELFLQTEVYTEFVEGLNALEFASYRKSQEWNAESAFRADIILKDGTVYSISPYRAIKNDTTNLYIRLSGDKTEKRWEDFLARFAPDVINAN